MFCIFILRSVVSASCVDRLVFFCIYFCVCDSWQMSSAKSRSEIASRSVTLYSSEMLAVKTTDEKSRTPGCEPGT